jgi:hypothetical protein
VPTGRHRQTHKLPRPKNPINRAAAVAAPVLTMAAVAVGISNAGVAAETVSPAIASSNSHALAQAVVVPLPDSVREQKVSRSSDRLRSLAREGKVTRKKVTRYATAPLNVRTSPTANAAVVDEIKPGTKLVATGIRSAGFAEVRFADTFRWVTAQYLSADKPAPAATPETMGLSGAPCPDGSVENGLTSGAVRVYRAVCHNFPQITSYGGWDAHGEHSSGRAIDIMTSDVTLGTQIADFLRAHASELDLYDVIWRQHIWTPVRSSEGWRSMPSRGSSTANHYDHVHVSVN